MRAALEGVAFALRSIRNVMAETESLDKLRIIGGGAKYDLWCRIIADVLGCTLEVPRMQSSDVTSLGAAVIAGEAVGLLSRSSVSGFGMIDTKQILPAQDTMAAYDKAYETYSKLYPAVKVLF